MNIDLIKHLYGFSNGVYFTVVVMVFLYGLSYSRQHHWRVTIVFTWVALAFACFGLYNIFFQQLFTSVTANLYASWFVRFCAVATPAAVLILTYIYSEGFALRSVRANEIVRKEKWVLYMIYITTIANMVALMFVDDVKLMSKMLLMGFVLPSIGAARLALLANEKSPAIYGFAFIFIFLTVVILTIGFYYINHHHEFSESHIVKMNVSLSLIVVLASFFSIRYGYTEVQSFFRIKSLDKRNLMSELTGAINSNQFSLHYQPQLDLKSGRVCGVEALIRWQHPLKGSIPPGEYIPFAEESGLINHITKWVVARAVEQGVLLKKQGFAMKMSVNFSAKNITPSMADYVEKILKKHNLPSRLLLIEMTESLAINTADKTFVHAMRRFKEMGVGVSIDDYGTGFSSLSHMQKLDIHELKIDRSFIENLSYDSDNYAIVCSTLQMARNLKLVSVAEGVEDDKTLAMLAELRCDLAQGYAIAKPMPFEELIHWLKQRQPAIMEPDEVTEPVHAEENNPALV